MWTFLAAPEVVNYEPLGLEADMWWVKTLCYSDRSKSAVCFLKNIFLSHDAQLGFFDVLIYLLYASPQECWRNNLHPVSIWKVSKFMPKPLSLLDLHLPTCLMATWQDDYGDVKSSLALLWCFCQSCWRVCCSTRDCSKHHSAYWNNFFIHLV